MPKLNLKTDSDIYFEENSSLNLMPALEKKIRPKLLMISVYVNGAQQTGTVEPKKTCVSKKLADNLNI
jgi:hypothetical protein